MLYFKIIGDSKVMLPLFNNNKPVLITLIKQSVQRLHPFTNFNKLSSGVGRLAVGLFILNGIMSMFSSSERDRKIKSCLYLIFPVFLQWERITPSELKCKQMWGSSILDGFAACSCTRVDMAEAERVLLQNNPHCINSQNISLLLK